MADYSNLKQKAQEVRNETKIAANTADRVGYVMEETVKAIEAEEQRARQAEAEKQPRLRLYHEDGTESVAIETKDALHLNGTKEDGDKVAELYISAEELLTLLNVSSKADDYTSSIRIKGKTLTLTAPDNVSFGTRTLNLGDVQGIYGAVFDGFMTKQDININGKTIVSADVIPGELKVLNGTSGRGLILRTVEDPDNPQGLMLIELLCTDGKNSYKYTFPTDSGEVVLRSELAKKQDKLEQYKEARAVLNGETTTTASITADRIVIHHTDNTISIVCTADEVSVAYNGGEVSNELNISDDGIRLQSSDMASEDYSEFVVRQDGIEIHGHLSLDSDIKDVGSEITSLKNDAADLRAEIESLEQQQQQSYEDTNAHIGELEGRSEDTNAHIGELEGRLEDTNAHIGELEGRLEDTNAHIGERFQPLEANQEQYSKEAENPEWLKVVTDGEGKVLWGIDRDGNVSYGVGVPNEVKAHVSKVIQPLEANQEQYSKEAENPEWLKVVTDGEGKVLWGIDRDGNVSYGVGVPNEVKAHVSKVIQPLEANQEQYSKEAENPEWLKVVTDGEGKVLWGIDRDGNVVTPNKDMFSLTDNNPEWLHYVVDNQGKVIDGIDKTGARYLAMPTNQDKKVLAQVRDYYKDTCAMLARIMRTDYKTEYANCIKPLPLLSYAGNNQNVHPKVLYFPGNLFGHKYWMAYTPYPNSNDQYENPCIAYSEDGISWTNISNNPISDTPSGGFNSDTHLVYNPNTGRLECWYREFLRAGGGSEMVYRKTSRNGLDWSDRELLRVGASSTSDLSPAAIYKDGKYHIWVVDEPAGYKIKYYTSTDGTDWQYVRDLSVSFVHDEVSYYVWHIDIIYSNGTYKLLAMCKRKNGDWLLFKATSADNITYDSHAVMLPSKDGWDGALYRSSLVETDTSERIYYSASFKDITEGQRWGIGVSESFADDKFVGINYIY